MKRRFHWSLAAGFALALCGILTFPVFAEFPATRSFAWLNLLLLTAGVILLVAGSMRAFRQPQIYRGKVLGGILTTLGVVLLGFFAVGIFYFGKIPQPALMQNSGEKAPEFSLLDQDGKTVTLTGLLSAPQTEGALLVFYRGYW